MHESRRAGRGGRLRVALLPIAVLAAADVMADDGPAPPPERPGITYERPGEAALAVEQDAADATPVRERDLDQGLLASSEEMPEQFAAVLRPVFVEASVPKVYTSDEVQALLLGRLTEDEMSLVVNPLLSTPEMEEWAEAATKGATTDLEKARALFEALSRRKSGEGHFGPRTAREVFAGWETATERMVCQDYAKLYVALARDVGVPAWNVLVNRDFAGQRVSHACAAVFIDGECLLVDHGYHWFGVPHGEFVVLDDIETIAHHLCQTVEGPDWLRRSRVARKIQPDSAFVRLGLAGALIDSDHWEEAKAEVEVAARLRPGRVEESICRGAIALHDGCYEAAVEHYLRAVEASTGCPRGHFGLGRALMHLGRLAEARDALREALRHNPFPAEEAAARGWIAWMDEILGGEPGKADVLDELRRAAEDGDACSQCVLGTLCYEGAVVPRDYARAAKWYLKAAEQGLPSAQTNLASCYSKGEGVAQDAAEAVKWYRKAAEQGVSDARFRLGVAYHEGTGVPRDYARAAEWFLKASELGHAEAQYNLAICYATGKGVAEDAAEAAKWYLEAAERGHGYAQQLLGSCCIQGLGVPRDEAEAMNWWRKAALQGIVNAQYNLAQAYAGGCGVPRDFAEAWAWARLAKNEIPEAGDLAFDLAARFTEEQLTKAWERLTALRAEIARSGSAGQETTAP